MAKPKVGLKAPVINLENQDGELFSSKKLETDYTVLFFYPKDMTPGCTIEAIEFTDSLPMFKKLDAQIFGISGDGVDSKKKFCKKNKLKINLLADEDFAVSKKYGAYGNKTFMGKTYKGVLRQTFILDKSGKIIQIYKEVKAEGHAEEVLEFISINKALKKIAKPKATKAKKTTKKKK